jgi:hypothetical protein
MQRFQKWIYPFTIMMLIVSACAPLQTADLGMAMLDQKVDQVNTAPGSPTPESEKPTEQPEPNECLDCHSDKDLLVETADPVEEIAESESKGVG